ncbi:MAG: hypothetical protein FWB74_06000 [Defluviitaleaceae bacterium]|nr:hypothetical protein [Defluviitaleaceae bacterium]
MLLYYCYPRGDVSPTARKLIKDFGTLPNLLDAPVQDIMSRGGVTENVAFIFSMMPELMKRYEQSKWKGRRKFKDSHSLAQFVRPFFIGKSHECFMMLYFDNGFRLIEAEMLEEGTLDEVKTYPRKIIDRMLAKNTAYVVLAHNHPSGCTVISEEDIELTESVKKWAEPCGIYVLDHIIIAGTQSVSFSTKYRKFPGIRDSKWIEN